MGDRYEQDFIGWTEAQARLLRQAAEGRPNVALDWTNLAEEIEDLGRSELHAVASQINRIVLHLAKLEFSPAELPRAGWMSSVREARAAVRRRLRHDPGLRPRLAALFDEEAADATQLAADALLDHGEDITAILSRQHSGSAYTQDQILGDWFPARAGQP